MDEVVLRAALLDEYRRGDARRREAAEVEVECLSGAQVVYIDKLDDRTPCARSPALGAANTPATTALGRAMLAFSPPEVVDAVYAEPIPPRTPRTVTDAAAARERLADVRRSGIAVDDVENEAGIRCVAAPVLDHTGHAVAAISVSGPEHRLTPDALGEVADAVRTAAEAVSRALGFRSALPGAPPSGAGGFAAAHGGEQV